ncbi:hypothetical protein [Planctobacterium marinum]|uniref:hypothetical protein n=1 Tax=Planctobacterium marinum TaxID=1631968 RepID=UPI001E452210|nr:hypothetical protein [Planctobacterium marinum]MCC2606830.1 hypothetical protein [Planctobacterium marinum]
MAYRIVILATALFLTLSCASGPQRAKSITNESFLTDIKENGAKLFVYIANFRGQAPAVHRGGNNNPAPPVSMSQLRSEMALRQEEMAIEALEYKLLTSGYCRDGYFILGNYNQFGSVEIRGECQESATDSDKRLFGS